MQVTREEIREFVQRQLEEDDGWAKHWLIEINVVHEHARQTGGRAGRGRRTGFSTGDATVLAPMARRLREGGGLSDTEVGLLCSMMPLYWRQVVRLMGGREAVLDWMRAVEQEEGEKEEIRWWLENQRYEMWLEERREWLEYCRETGTPLPW